MGGIIGATSGKFISIGAVLLVQGRIDGNPVTLAIAPASATSAISTSLAERVGPADGHPLHIHIRREYFTAAVNRTESSPAVRADARLGMDVLTENPIVVDFTRHSLRLIDTHEARAMQRYFYQLKLGADGDGNATIGIIEPAAPSRLARFESIRSSAGGSEGIATGACLQDASAALSGSGKTVGLDLFRNQTVIFDFARHSIWLRKSADAARLLCSAHAGAAE